MALLTRVFCLTAFNLLLLQQVFIVVMHYIPVCSITLGSPTYPLLKQVPQQCMGQSLSSTR